MLTWKKAIYVILSSNLHLSLFCVARSPHNYMHIIIGNVTMLEVPIYVIWLIHLSSDGLWCCNMSLVGLASQPSKYYPVVECTYMNLWCARSYYRCRQQSCFRSCSFFLRVVNMDLESVQSLQLKKIHECPNWTKISQVVYILSEIQYFIVFLLMCDGTGERV